MAGSSGYIWWSVMVMLVSGTFSAIATKVLYQLKSDGVCHENKFGKSYMFTLWMFIGEAMCLATYYFRQWQDKPSREKQALLDAEHEHHTGRPSHDGSEEGKQPPIWVYVILSCFDLSATAIGGVGLLYVNASTNQMLRGSGVLFTGLFTILILKRRLSRRQWGGILMVILGLGLVGGAASLQAKLDKDDGKENNDNTASPLEAVIGVILVLVGAALNSAQGVFEEKLMKASGAAEVDPLKLVGWEGISGTVLSSFLLLPVAEQIPGSDCGKAENTTDSLIQMYNRPLIALVLVLYAFCLALMNYYSQVISKELSAVHRMLVSTLRTVLVWIVGIVTYYYISRDFGESWVVTSYMQLGGFVALFVGTFIYGVKPAEQKEAEPLPDVVSDHQVQHTTY